MTNHYRSYNDHYGQTFVQYHFHVQRFYKQFAIQSEMAWILQENYYKLCIFKRMVVALYRMLSSTISYVVPPRPLLLLARTNSFHPVDVLMLLRLRTEGGADARSPHPR